MQHDDDPLDRSLSSSRLDRADQGRGEMKECRLKEKDKRERAALQRQILRGQMKVGKDDPVKTRSLEEDIQRDIKTADEKTDAEKLIDDEQRQEDVQDAAGVEQQQDLS